MRLNISRTCREAAASSATPDRPRARQGRAAMERPAVIALLYRSHGKSGENA